MRKSRGCEGLRAQDVIRRCAVIRAGWKGRAKVMRGYRLTLDEAVWIEQRVEAECMLAAADATLERYEGQQLHRAAED